MSTPYRSRSASPDDRRQPFAASHDGEGRELLAHVASSPSGHFFQSDQQGGAIDSAELFPLHSPPLVLSNDQPSPTRSPSPLPSPNYTFPIRSPAIEITNTKAPSPPQPKRKPSLDPTDPNPLISISPLSGLALSDQEQWCRLTVSAPPSLVRESGSSESSGQRSDVEDNGVESSTPRMLKEGRRDKVLSTSAEAVPTTSRRGSLVEGSSVEKKTVSPTDYLFPLPLTGASFSNSPFTASLPNLSVPRVRSLGSLPRSSPPYNILLNGSPSSSPESKSKPSFLPYGQTLTREQQQAQRIAELEIEVKMFRDREDEWEEQAEALVRGLKRWRELREGGLRGF